jgi:D-beta-D-heptose 7-phosphate kinase / D-beta-D-heptose 1-phosphate adenosyltransferase
MEITKDFLGKNRRKRLNIHCVGDAMVDEYYAVRVNRISPEFPMPIMHSSHDKPVKRPGGVANVAYQFKHFNVAPTLMCLPDRRAEKVFSDHGLYVWGHFSDIRAKLPVKKRFLDGGTQVTRHDVETPLCGLKPDSIDHYIKSLGDQVARHKMSPDVVILSDYDKGFFSSEDHNVLDFYNGRTTIVDPKKGPLAKWKGCTIFKPNAKEAEELTGRKTWREQAKHIQNELGCEAVVVTNSGDRVAGVWKSDFFCFEPADRIAVDSVVGAGDCFAAFFAMAIGHGFSPPDAAYVAYNAGAVYVQHRMNRPVVPAELCPHSVVDPRDLASRDFKLVLTNGCFDILHDGHLETLRFAKSKGDKLVVAVNSDASVARLKGGDRPVVPLARRMAVLAELKCVDFVVSFDEDDPGRVIRMIGPDVLVKGGDYKKGEIVGADRVSEVHVAPLIEGVSTSGLLAGYLQAQPAQSHLVLQTP